MGPMWNDLLVMTIPLADKVLRTIAVYLVITILLRLAGKRLMAQMNNLDLVVVLLLSNVVQNAIIGPDNSLLGGVIGAVVLIGANAGLDRLSQRFPHLAWLLEGSSTVLVNDGVMDARALRRVGTTKREFGAVLHLQGADEISEVASAILEPGGQIDVRLKADERAVNKREFDAAIAVLKRAIADAGGCPPAVPATTTLGS